MGEPMRAAREEAEPGLRDGGAGISSARTFSPTPRFPVTIVPGQQVDKDIRLDVCAIEAYDGGDTEVAAPAAIPLPL